MLASIAQQSRIWLGYIHNRSRLHVGSCPKKMSFGTFISTNFLLHFGHLYSVPSVPSDSLCVFPLTRPTPHFGHCITNSPIRFVCSFIVIRLASEDPVLRSAVYHHQSLRITPYLVLWFRKQLFCLTDPRPTKKRGFFLRPLAFRSCAGPCTIGTPLPARSGRKTSGLNYTSYALIIFLIYFYSIILQLL